ncbi:MAG: P-loop NTPase [Proteobacteria bacterium]|nr:P-loop NTPase [Pseudomonadota bacterium]
MDKEWESVEGSLVLSGSAQKPQENPFSSNISPRIQTQKRARIWAVGGGKGGVGKSLICANVCWVMARKGRRVLAIDLDLGGANLHTCLGVTPPKVGIGDWVEGRVDHLRQLMVPTAQVGLLHISGYNDPLKILSLMEKRVDAFLDQIREMDFDEVFIDLGAGTHDLTIKFFNAADNGLLSILPEPTSVENAYRFIRALFYERLMQADVPKGVRDVIEAAIDTKNILGLRAPVDLFAVVERLDPEACEILRKQASTLSPHIVINQVRTQVDIDVGKAICSVSRRFFGIDLKYAGYIDYDNSVWKAIRSKRPAVAEFPRSPLSTRLEKLTEALMKEEIKNSP